MPSIQQLNVPCDVVGRIEAIIVRGSPRDAAHSIAATVALAGIGLADDRLGQRGGTALSTRQVTLIQAEHLEVIARIARVESVDPRALRRNLVVSGINLFALRNARVIVGDAMLEIVGPCQPCSPDGRGDRHWRLRRHAGPRRDDSAHPGEWTCSRRGRGARGQLTAGQGHAAVHHDGLAHHIVARA